MFASDCSHIKRRYADLVAIRIYQKKLYLNPTNLSQTLKDILAHTGSDAPSQLESVIRYSLENAYQHGVEDFYLPQRGSSISIEIFESISNVEIRITNPRKKVFPKKLERKFAPGESVELSLEDRPTPRGMGLGLKAIFRAFQNFPKHSFLAWKSSEDNVVLRIHYPK